MLVACCVTVTETVTDRGPQPGTCVFPHIARHQPTTCHCVNQRSTRVCMSSESPATTYVTAHGPRVTVCIDTHHTPHTTHHAPRHHTIFEYRTFGSPGCASRGGVGVTRPREVPTMNARRLRQRSSVVFPLSGAPAAIDRGDRRIATVRVREGERVIVRVFASHRTALSSRRVWPHEYQGRRGVAPDMAAEPV
ncbi:hypothetical protein L227DRAFT_245976 [Lentinus tigrinus ALCF2SS1-6]|uniref:Uncharacterized protein n=1 Tax=Lentinus tigrinus ALCF2SS1-6 TaxID=1328759 RepID=A0A5C2S0C3_9APHY|nr:hypothetical protein L227DRAFT_245976 [Lentinus tigrinus ALCF2SS1-6]